MRVVAAAVALLATLAAPAPARTPDPVLRLPVSRGAVLAGVTWDSGAPRVELRQRSPAGWGPWTELEPDAAAAPGEAAGVRPGTEPLWLARGTSLVEARLSGPVRGARLELVRDPGPSAQSEQGAKAIYRRRLGDVVTRAGWGADESLRSGRLEYHPAVTAVVVHHTVTPNDYTEAEAAGYVRAVYAYHTRSRGYRDIGYNLLVDRFGTLYEGRAGGFERGIVGAHTAGFNEGTVGIALLGDFESAPAPKAAMARIAAAGSWAAERWHFDPRGTVTLTSQGAPRFRRGTRVTVPRLAGHRDLGWTACPGKHAYAELPALRQAAWHGLAAAFTSVTVTGDPLRPPHPVELRARLDHAADWQVTIDGPFGPVPAQASGRGRTLDLSWDGMLPPGLPAPPGEYHYVMTADDGVHGPSDPVSGTFHVTLPL